MTDIKQMILLISTAVSIILILAVVGLVYQNKSLRANLTRAEAVIVDQNKFLAFYQEKEEQSLKEIATKQEELEALKKKRIKDEIKSEEFFKWRDIPVPTDIIKFMRGK